MFCKYCGKEVAEHAFVCPSCGGLIGELPNAQAQAQKAKEADQFFGNVSQPNAQTANTPQPPSRKYVVFARVSKIVSIISLVFSGLTAFLLMLAFMGGVSGSYGDGSGYAMLAFGWIYAIICGAVALELGIVGFVFGRIQKYDLSVKKLSKVAVILCIIAFAWSIFFIFSPFFYMM